MGLWRTYTHLPEIHPISPYFFWALLGIGILGINYYKKSTKTLYPIAIMTMTLIWAFIQTYFAKIYAYANKMAENPYSVYEPSTVVNIIVYAPLLAGFFIFIFMFRVLVMMQKADPLFQEGYEGAKTRDMILKAKAKISRLNKKAQNIKTIWSLTDMDANEEDIRKIPLSKRLRGIIKALFEKNFEEEFRMYICTDVKTNKKISIDYLDMFLHFLILGPTGSGKTFSIIKPIVWQILKYIVQKKKIGLTIVEPKGDLAEDIANWCKRLGLPHIYINPLDESSAKFNPLQGDAQVVAESTRTVLKKLFGKQEAFFAQVQETSARNTILLLKRLYGDDLDLHDVVQILRDQEKLKSEVQKLEQAAGTNDDLVQYFQKEILGSLKSDYQKFAMGLRMQLEDLLGDDMLKKVITGNSDINFDEHLKKGGILIVNTAMGRLGKLGDAFGTFVVMHLQNAVFRRPGTEHTRTPHVLIIDEAPRYINPDFERLLAIGRSFRCACVLAIQSLGQLQLEEKKAFLNIVMTNCRSKVIFGGTDEEDARKLEREFGQVDVSVIQPTYNYEVVVPQLFPKSYRVNKTTESRFSFTQIKELPQYHFIYHLMVDGQLQKPSIGTGIPVDINAIKVKHSQPPTEPMIKSKCYNQNKAIEPKPISDPEPAGIKFIKPAAIKKEEDAKKEIQKAEIPGPGSREEIADTTNDAWSAIEE